MRTGYDSINALLVPAGAPIYLGYDDGEWPDAPALAARFPGATVVRATTNPNDLFGDLLDVENGDASPSQAPRWTAARRAAGHGGPLTYCNASTWAEVIQQYADQGVAQPGYVVASYPGAGPGIPAGAVAHQWASNANYDTTTWVNYLPGIDPTPRPPDPPPVTTQYPEENMASITAEVLIEDGAGWLPSPVLANKVFAVTIDTTNPDVSHTYAQVPVFRGVATQVGPDSPNGALQFSGGGLDGTFGVVIWYGTD